ncbi:hypothetical protein JW921_02400 [Candidatus Fermentibacterales bacterium]|nr:hypothetical protein [Candidatus Fermentibacterales bacterium]
MPDEETQDQGAAVRELLQKFDSLRKLHGRKVISRDLFGRQVLQLMSSPPAIELMSRIGDDDMKARRLLTRLSDPERWRNESSLPLQARKKLLTERLAEAVLGASGKDPALIETLIDLVQLPHFASFVKLSRDEDGESGRTGGKVSVLD